MVKDKSKVIFWKEIKRIQRSETNESLTVKNENGERVYDPEEIKEAMANFYEKLYAKRQTRPHPHHEQVKKDMEGHQNDMSHENEWYNYPPTEDEIKEIINNKKNGKASTDLKNEIMKNGNDHFVKTLMPLVNAIWTTEKIPKQWNKGSITSIWKGKGEKEKLENHRGITVSSAIGSVLEEVIDKRLEGIIKFSQGQAGGVKGAATADHLFLVRGLMTIAISEKKNLFLTFFDVQKAYDRADVENMLHIMWQAGVKGKMWRILKNLSTNLTATVKTRFGPSRELTRGNGGKQGSRATGRCFSKQMDTLSEDFINLHKESVQINDEFRIGCLEWVDDVMSATTGKTNQQSVLKIVDEFAVKNKLEWGETKCQVMQVGRKCKVPDEWQLGDKKIKNTTSYKYLGETITNDNKNKQNLEIKENKAPMTIRQINTTASSEIMRGIETKVLLTLYETSVIPSLLNNCESWTLTKSEETQLDKIGTKMIKRLFNLPTTTPSTSIIYSLGLLYITQVVDKKRFMYLHKILTRENDHWTKKMLRHLETANLGWAKNITEKLEEYHLGP